MKKLVLWFDSVACMLLKRWKNKTFKILSSFIHVVSNLYDFHKINTKEKKRNEKKNIVQTVEVSGVQCCFGHPWLPYMEKNSRNIFYNIFFVFLCS